VRGARPAASLSKVPAAEPCSARSSEALAL